MPSSSVHRKIKQRGRGPCPANFLHERSAVHRKIKQRGCRPCPANFLREREWARPWPHAGRPCPPYIVPLLVDPTKLKYLAITVMTAASTVLAKSVRFIEHVSTGCCAGITSIVLVFRSAWICPYQASRVFSKLFTEKCTSTHGLSSSRKLCLPCDLPFPRLSLYRRTNRRTDRQTDTCR